MAANSVHGCIAPDAGLRPQNDAEQIMSMPASPRHRWTRAEIDRLIQDRSGYTPRYELVGGELLVTSAPSRRHQRMILELAFALRLYATAHALGEVVISPCELRLNAEDYYEPDLFVAPALDGRFPSSDRPAEHAILACEVLSASSSRHDRITKRRAFQALGVPDYWVIDPHAEAIEVTCARSSRAWRTARRSGERPARPNLYHPLKSRRDRPILKNAVFACRKSAVLSPTRCIRDPSRPAGAGHHTS